MMDYALDKVLCDRLTVIGIKDVGKMECVKVMVCNTKKSCRKSIKGCGMMICDVD
jgi:hypothetical protein